ncbi:expressed unknown protein [Seminavis robusta]|uniref:Uncharacterized protein n=1 Tax=Seminavis robusta TaxID=568900 RepID=A0A9N8EGV9_9STRA|nr:expressed unknown protein [Seminavis robusta]|eukprot:Sro1077_g238610.1 n/a (105) ;mRNA; f:20123-20437
MGSCVSTTSNNKKSSKNQIVVVEDQQKNRKLLNNRVDVVEKAQPTAPVRKYAENNTVAGDQEEALFEDPSGPPAISIFPSSPASVSAGSPEMNVEMKLSSPKPQ